jgi:hypothetical protein
MKFPNPLHLLIICRKRGVLFKQSKISLLISKKKKEQKNWFNWENRISCDFGETQFLIDDPLFDLAEIVEERKWIRR